MAQRIHGITKSTSYGMTGFTVNATETDTGDDTCIRIDNGQDYDYRQYIDMGRGQARQLRDILNDILGEG